MQDKTLIYSHLYAWYESSKRILPWRETEDPYAIWLSEVILQQTRVAQGLDYYRRFLNRWPTVKALSEADEAEVLREWQGLGYYSRARNLHKAAKQIVESLKLKVEREITVPCKEGAVKILELQVPGKKRMDARSFLNGLH